MSRLLFVTRRPPWPLTNGARIRSHRLLEGLSQRFDTVLLTMTHPEGSPDGATDLEALGHALPRVEVRTVPGPAPRSKRLDQLASVRGPRSWHFGRYATPDFAWAVASLAEERGVELVHGDDLGAALVLPCGRPVVTVYGSHNIEHHLVRSDGRASPAAGARAFAALEWRKLRAEERRVWAAADLSLAVSARDADAMRAGSVRAVALCPNGTDAVEPTPRRRRPAGAPLRLLFVGSAAYAPYERGLAWFGDRVLPLVRRHRPVVLDVIGQPPRRPAGDPEVRHRGYVDDVTRWYRRADVVIVPVFEGSGTRLKVVEAAAHARPIVSTRLGAEGLPLQAGRHYLEADTPADFAAAIDRIADGSEDRADRTGGDELIEAMVRGARRAVAPLLWPAITAELTERYTGLLHERAGQAR
ncbi:MAG: glycosyltransferase [Vicinamibacterales bacterium]